MKLIIDIPEESYKWIRDNYENPCEEIAYYVIKRGKPYEEQKQGDLISRKALLNAIEKERHFLLSRGQSGAEHILVHHCLRIIDDAPTVPLPDFKEGYKQAIKDGKTNFSRQQGECENCDFRKFSEKFVDGAVEVMNKNGITTLEQLSEILKGGVK